VERVRGTDARVCRARARGKKRPETSKAVVMRIGILAPPWLPVPPLAYGGTEAIIDTLARGLTAAGHEVLLWTVGDSTCPVPRDSVFPVAMPERMGAASLEIRHVLAGYERFASWGADLVHDHTLVGPLVADRFREIPVVTTNHGRFDIETEALYQSVSDRVAVVAISGDQAARARDVRIARVIHHGIDIDRFPFGRGEGDEDGPLLVFLGRMSSEKGPDVAARLARQAGMRLVLAAKMRAADEFEYYERNVKPLLGDDIVYIGEASHAQKIELLGKASALVNPIGWPEPFGLAMVEALACGTPVLATEVGSAPEIIDHGVTGFLCTSAGDMLSCLAKVGEIDRAACRAAAESRFSATRMIEDHIALYRRICAGSDTPEDALAGEAA
jgi:glycosyltransferase involved in cell wall biosynthesis